MELVITKVKRGVDWFERFEINVDLTFLSLRRNNFTAVYNQAIWRNLVVKLETLLGRRNRRKDRETVDTGLDVGSSSLYMTVKRLLTISLGIELTNSSANIFAALDT